MPLYGYARVSTIDQNLAVQRAALKAAGCDIIRAENASGARRDGRSELQILLDFLRQGDTLVVTRIDRLARSVKDLQDIMHELKAKGVALKATEQPVDTATAAAKARGVYKGRKPTIDTAEVRRLKEEEKLGPAGIACRLGIGRASVYRVLGKAGRSPAGAG